MPQTHPRGPRTPLLPRTESLFATGSLAPPDTSLFTTFSPDLKKTSHAYLNPLSVSIGGTQPFSYNLTFRLQSFGNGVTSGYVMGQVILQLRAPGNVGGVGVLFTSAGFILNAWYGGQTLTILDNVLLNEWYDVTFTWDGSTATAYLDGAAILSVPVSQEEALASTVFQFGSAQTDPPARPSVGVTDGPFSGDLKRFFVWNTCLSAADVMQQVWTHANEPVQSASLLLGRDFTVSPPAKVGSSPTLHRVNLGYLSQSTALFSGGTDLAVPGPGTQANPGGAAPFSILAWVFAGSPQYDPPQLNGYIISNGDATDTNHIGVRLSNGSVVVEFGSQTVTSATAIAGNQWYYLGVTYDGSTCSIYLNGTVSASGEVSSAGTPSKPALALWGILDDGEPSGLWSGYIQFLSIWDVALTAAQVAGKKYEDPTIDAHCTANFILATQPPVDSIAVKTYGLWGADEVQPGTAMYVDPNTQLWRAESIGLVEPRRTGLHRVSTHRPSPPWPGRRGGRVRRHRVEPFSAAHRALMVNEFKAALAAMQSPEHAGRLLEEYRAEVDRVFDLAATSPHLLTGPRVSYREVDGELGLFYHAGANEEIDLKVRLALTQKCEAWWIVFILDVFVGVVAIFGIEGSVTEMTEVAQRMATDPSLLAVLDSVLLVPFTVTTLLSLIDVLSNFGYLEMMVWAAVAGLSWWVIPKFVAYTVALVEPFPNPQKVEFAVACVQLVATLVLALVDYDGACG